MNISIALGIFMLGVGIGALLTRISYHGQLIRLQTGLDVHGCSSLHGISHTRERIGLSNDSEIGVPWLGEECELPLDLRQTNLGGHS
jgi:hypothetical protein